jgi:hypothetical protein
MLAVLARRIDSPLDTAAMYGTQFYAMSASRCPWNLTDM